MPTQRLLRITWLLMASCVVAGSLLRPTSAPMRMLDQLDVNDKVLHLVAYFTLSLLPGLRETRRVTMLLAACVVALGISLEFGQRLVPGRSFEIADIAANTVGVLFGLAAAGLVRPKLGQGICPSPTSAG